MKELNMNRADLAQISLAMFLACSCKSSEGQPLTVDDVARTSGNVPIPKQLGPAGEPRSPGTDSSETYVRPGTVFLGSWWGATHVVTGRFTGKSEFSESTARLRTDLDGLYDVSGFTNYEFIPDQEVGLSYRTIGVTKCSLTDPRLQGASDTSDISEISVSWGLTQVIDGSGAPYHWQSRYVAWQEPAVPAGVASGGQVLLLLNSFPFPESGQQEWGREVRYVLEAAFPVVDGIVTQSDSTTLTLAEIEATARERMVEVRRRSDAKLACAEPQMYPDWPGYSDPSCRRTDCEVPSAEAENP